MSYCALTDKQCIITQDVFNADTLLSTGSIKGLKDCSEKNL